MSNEQQDAFIGISRHRLATDGQGVTTLAAFYGCPLRCQYCLNPQSWKENQRLRYLTAEELYEMVKIDQLYFLATGGGVTFGGGEPLLRPTYLARFRELCGPTWHLCVETSLAVPPESVRMVADCIDEWIVDCKDTDPVIYERYTGKSNTEMLENLRSLARWIPPSRIVVRIPLIPKFNTEEHCQASERLLASFGITRFDHFVYRTENRK